MVRNLKEKINETFLCSIVIFVVKLNDRMSLLDGKLFSVALETCRYIMYRKITITKKVFRLPGMDVYWVIVINFSFFFVLQNNIGIYLTTQFNQNVATDKF